MSGNWDWMVLVYYMRDVRAAGGVYKFTRGICDMEGKNVIRRFISGEDKIYASPLYLLYDIMITCSTG